VTEITWRALAASVYISVTVRCKYYHPGCDKQLKLRHCRMFNKDKYMTDKRGVVKQEIYNA